MRKSVLWMSKLLFGLSLIGAALAQAGGPIYTHSPDCLLRYDAEGQFYACLDLGQCPVNEWCDFLPIYDDKGNIVGLDCRCA